MKKNQQGSQLGIDVGVKRVGLAICNVNSRIALPMCTIRRDAIFNSDIKLIVHKIIEKKITKVFIGYPKSLKNKFCQSVSMVEEYFIYLNKDIKKHNLEIPIKFVDERFSTLIVRKRFQKIGVKFKKIKQIIDQFSAAEILQRVIDKKYK